MVEEFQRGEAPVFLLSLKAGGTGLTLTRATHVLHYDRWWNPAVEDQATDRAYRIGQDRPVQVHRLIAEGTLADRIAALLEKKRELAESVVGSGEGWITELSDDELTDLVSARQLGRAATLLDGDLPPEVAADVAGAGLDLLPGSGEVGPRCTCPDDADRASTRRPSATWSPTRLTPTRSWS